MADLYVINARYRKRLLAQDKATAGQLLDAYRGVWARLKEDLAAVLADIEAEPENSAFRVSRLQALEGQVVEQLARFAAQANGAVTEAQRAAILIAAESMADQLTEALSGAPIATSFTALPTRAIESLVGFASDGSPLAALFAEISVQGGEVVRDRLLAGLAMGHGPDVLAAEMRAELGVPLTRALRIARTETMRAYREGSRAYLEENAVFVAGWYWVAAKDLRTCPVCWAMDGTFHPIEEPFASHVNCRCTTIPGTKPVEGWPAPWAPKETGEAAFEKLGRDEQRRILGRGKFDLYDNGEISLADLVQEGEDERWGPYRVEKALKALT